MDAPPTYPQTTHPSLAIATIGPGGSFARSVQAQKLVDAHGGALAVGHAVDDQSRSNTSRRRQRLRCEVIRVCGFTASVRGRQFHAVFGLEKIRFGA